MADSVPQPPASSVDQALSDTADARDHTVDGQLAAAMNQMELGTWPTDEVLSVVDDTLEAARVEHMVRVGEIENAIANRHQERQLERPTAPTFPP